MTEFTIQRGKDGFGSQMITTLLGYLWATENKKTFHYLPLSAIKLSFVGIQNQELKKLNKILTTMMTKLDVAPAKPKTTRYKTLQQLYDQGPLTFTTLPNLHGCWPIPREDHRKILSIHIRMGGDVVPENKIRCQPIEYYNDLIKRCLKTFPDHIIQLISWGEPDIDEDLKSKVLIESNVEPGEILYHYSLMIHSDILIIGSSSFSMSAGLLSSGKILADKDIIHISPRYPEQWNSDFKALLG